MASNLDYQSVGLGITFQTPQSSNNADFSRLHQDLNTSLYGPEIPASHFPMRAAHGHHQRTQSAVIPQRSTFEQSFSPQPQIHVPRSAHPIQRPFQSPPQRFGVDSNHSTPSTPRDGFGMPYPYPVPSSERRDFPSRETVMERRQRRRLTDLRAPPQYMNSPVYMDSPADGYNRNDGSSNSGSSYLYMTPSVHSTPYSEAGQFPVAEPFENHSTYHTPHLMQSPVFEHGSDKAGRIEEQDEMPTEPYVPTVMTSFPPLRPSALRRHTTEEFKEISDNNDAGNSLLSSPRSSPTETPSMKDRKVAYSRWSSSEDLLLKDAIAKHGDGKWSLVAQMVPGRTAMQCSTRWQGALNTSIHKGRWDPEEDMILIKAVSEWQAWHLADNKDTQSMEVLNEELYKNIPWSNIAQLLPRQRTGVQALARWSEALDPRITKGKWTEQEDAALLKGIERYGKCWIKIANCVQGRTQRQCRTRYCQISDKKRKVHGGPMRSNSRDHHYSD